MKKAFLAVLLLVSTLVSAQTFKPNLGVHYWDNQWTKTTAAGVYSNPELKQIDFGVYWRNLEPIEGLYDWSLIKNELDSAVKYKKQVGIVIGSGGSSPDWVNKNNRYTITGVRADGEGKTYTISYPYPFDTAYTEAWCRFIDAFGAFVRVKAIAAINIGGITITNGEFRLPQQNPTSFTPTLTKTDNMWVENGYDNIQVIQTWQKFKNAWARNFPNAMFYVNMMSRYEFPEYANPSMDKESNFINDSILSIIANTKNPDRYVVINTSLTATTKERNDFIGKANQLGINVAFQLNEGMYNNDYSEDGAAQAIENAIKLKGKFIQFQPIAAESYKELIKSTNQSYYSLYGTK
mgnify:FL=1